MKLLLCIITIFLLLIGVSFAIINDQIVPLDIYFTKISLPFSIWLVSVLCLGVLWGLLISAWRVLVLTRKKKQLEYQIKQISKELNTLRTLPIKDTV